MGGGLNSVRPSHIPAHLRAGNDDDYDHDLYDENNDENPINDGDNDVVKDNDDGRHDDEDA